MSKLFYNADGYGKWANLPISNDKGLTIYSYPMLANRCFLLFWWAVKINLVVT